ncbi:MAG: hypothetical protein ACRD1X_10805 [Vicinamibacteria bacterium]
MKAPALLTAALLIAGLAVGLSANAPYSSPGSQDTATDPPSAPSYPIPDNLVVDLRLFESRSTAPDFAAMSELSFFIMTDGRDVSATQWPSTLAKQVPDTFLAALIADTVPVEQGVARFEWTTGTRSIRSEIHMESYHPAGTFKAQLQVRFMRGGDTLREHSRELDLQMHRTSVWSSDELEITPSDYVSHFREFADRESRGQLYELLRPNTFFLILAATPRLLTDEEAQRWEAAQTLALPEGVEPPALENPTSIPLKGKILLSFELDENGQPVNPQIARSSFPEANLRVVEEALQWQFPATAGVPQAGRVEIELDVPASNP